MKRELYHIYFMTSGPSSDASMESILDCLICYENSKTEKVTSKCPFIKILDEFVASSNNNYLRKYGGGPDGRGGLCGSGEKSVYYGKV